uniref:Uncharacterized protein n=1 Tax=Meloidogyne enterolobii TaxID=390850 RepID=A0A6V7XIZ7_MELEN|nr:unnamed protein product [Meloidogyne enterolobii]
MKLISVLNFLIFNAILWSLINSVKKYKYLNELSGVEETSKDSNKILTNEAESSANPPNEKYKNLEPTGEIKKELNNDKEAKRLKMNEYNRNSYQKNRKSILEKKRNWYKINKEKVIEKSKNYYKVNKEELKEKSKHYQANNKEKLRKRNQNYYKTKKEKIKGNQTKILKNESKSENVNSLNNDSENKGKEPIVGCTLAGGPLRNGSKYIPFDSSRRAESNGTILFLRKFLRAEI